jgi:hypothetical protein
MEALYHTVSHVGKSQEAVPSFMRAPAVLLGDDMLNVVRQLAVLLAQQAILATMIRSSSDKVPLALPRSLF